MDVCGGGSHHCRHDAVDAMAVHGACSSRLMAADERLVLILRGVASSHLKCEMIMINDED